MVKEDKYCNRSKETKYILTTETVQTHTYIRTYYNHTKIIILLMCVRMYIYIS